MYSFYNFFAFQYFSYFFLNYFIYYLLLRHLFVGILQLFYLLISYYLVFIRIFTTRLFTHFTLRISLLFSFFQFLHLFIFLLLSTALPRVSRHPLVSSIHLHPLFMNHHRLSIHLFPEPKQTSHKTSNI